MPLQAVLAWLAGAVNVEGILEGSVSAQGTVKNPTLVGSVNLSDGRVDLRTVGQTLEDVSGRAIFDEDGVAISNLKATDTRGNATVNGRVGFEELRPNNADFTVNANSFPLRQEGTIVARVQGNARMLAEFEDEALTGEVRLQTLSIDIPESSATPQDLATHPEVFIIGADYEPVEEAPPYPIKLKLRSEDKIVILSP